MKYLNKSFTFFTGSSDNYDRIFGKEKKHCKCKTPVWTINDLKHCANCGGLLPDNKRK